MTQAPQSVCTIIQYKYTTRYTVSAVKSFGSGWVIFLFLFRYFKKIQNRKNNVFKNIIFKC